MSKFFWIISSLWYISAWKLSFLTLLMFIRIYITKVVHLFYWWEIISMELCYADISGSNQAKEERVMKSPAVTTIKEIGYSEDMIKAAINTIKSRLSKGRACGQRYANYERVVYEVVFFNNDIDATQTYDYFIILKSKQFMSREWLGWMLERAMWSRLLVYCQPQPQAGRCEKNTSIESRLKERV